MHIKSIVSDEDREELERMLSLGFIICLLYTSDAADEL